MTYKNDPTEEYDTIKEYTQAEIFEQYCHNNNVPDEVQQYIDELECEKNELRKMAKEIRELRDILCILNSEQLLRLNELERKLIKTLTKKWL